MINRLTAENIRLTHENETLIAEIQRTDILLQSYGFGLEVFNTSYHYLICQTPHFHCQTDSRPFGKVVKGIYRDGMKEVRGAIKIAYSSDQLTLLQKELCDLIAFRNIHQNNSKYIVNLLQSTLLESTSIYSTNSGRLSSSSGIFGLVLEVGECNLLEFLENESPKIHRIEILYQIVEAVNHLHRLSYVHLDLKPENIVYFNSVGSTRGRWKLIDFESCRDLSHSNLVVHGNVLASIEYAAPEIVSLFFPHDIIYGVPSSRPLTLAVDIWSVGLIAFFLLGGHKVSTSIVCEWISGADFESFLRRFDYKSRSFIQGCLVMDPFLRTSAQSLLEKSLFSTDNATLSNDALCLKGIMSYLNEIFCTMHDNQIRTLEHIDGTIRGCIRDLHDSISQLHS